MLLENKIQSLVHYIKKDKGFFIGIVTLTAAGLLDSYVTQINLKEIDDEANPIGRLVLEHWGTAGLYYVKVAAIGMVIVPSKLYKYGKKVLYGSSALWGFSAATWYLY